MLNSVLSALSSPTTVSFAALVMETVLHVIPSDKPLGLLHGVTALVEKVKDVSAALALFLDKVIPQNIVPK